MNFQPSQTQSTIQAALGNFLAYLLGPTFAIVEGQDNRVAEPSAQDFVVMTFMGMDRAATNFDTYQDCSFTGSIAGTTLTVSSILLGSIVLNTELFGTGVAQGTQILSQTSGTPGGVGAYKLSGAAQTVASEKMASGQVTLLQTLQVTYQLDVHGDHAASNAMLISTMFRDEVGQRIFGHYGASNIAPISCDSPTQMPFENENQQIETRWVLNADLSINVSMTAPQEFADKLKIYPILPADIVFPAT